MTDLKKWLEFAYKAVSKEADRQGRRHKTVYDLRVRESQLQPGDRVLVQNVGMRGKRKIANRWEKDVYLVVDQPNKGIPVYLLKREHDRGRRRMLDRNLLLPFMALPASKSKRKAMNRNWYNQKANPTLIPKREINKYYK